MKKITAILSLFIIASLFCLKAQNDLAHRHEFKLNLGTSVFMAFPEVSYEYILSEDMSVGAAMGFGFDTKEYDPYRFRATPFLRWFFGRMQQPAAGFFIEANAAMGIQDIYTYNYDTSSMESNYLKDKSMFAVGLGLAAGWKYLSKNNWVGDLFLGAGRNLVYDKDYDGSIYPRIGISIGKRF